MLADGEDVTEAIRTPEVTELASALAGDPEKRRVIVDKQRALVARGDWVIEGRDTGDRHRARRRGQGVPDGVAAERARRRAAQEGRPVEEVEREQAERDAKDNTLGRSVLTPAEGAIGSTRPA